AGDMACDRRPNAPGSGDTGGCAVWNTEGPVRSNRIEPFQERGDTSFDALFLLKSEGQPFTSRVGMTATNALSVVLETNVGGGQVGGPYTLSFGGKTASGGGPDGGEIACGGGCSSNVTVDFSTDGVSFTPVGFVTLTPDDARFQLPLGGVGGS